MTSSKSHRRSVWIAITAIAVLATCALSPVWAGTPTLLTNGKFYTGTAKAPWAEAVVIEDGTFIFVGAANEAAQIAGTNAIITDLGGKTVVPGLYDSHVHPLGAGQVLLYQCSIDNEATFDEFLNTIQVCTEKLPEGAWLQGIGWGPHLLEPTDMTFGEMLAKYDEATSGHPAFLHDFSHHNGYANTAAMQAANLTDEMLAELGDLVLRDDQNKLTGFFFEQAGSSFQEMLPSFTPEEDIAALSAAIGVLHKHGFVGVLDSFVSPDITTAYLALEAEDKLNLHVGLSLGWHQGDASFSEYSSKFLEEVARTEDSNLIDSHFAKIAVDGTPPTHTAAFLEPYEGTQNLGTLNLPAAELAQIITWLDANGITAQMHTVGDRAVRVTLDAIETAREANGPSAQRHQLAHACLIDDADIPRFGKLNAVANFSPMFWYPGPLVNQMNQILGSERMSDYCPAVKLRDSGSQPTNGSDWPVVADVNPWNGMEALITRSNPFGEYLGETLAPNEAVTVEEAIEIFTINGARVLGIEDKAGSIENGKSADLVVLNQDIFSVPSDKISDTKAVQVYFQGRALLH